MSTIEKWRGDRDAWLRRMEAARSVPRPTYVYLVTTVRDDGKTVDYLVRAHNSEGALDAVYDLKIFPQVDSINHWFVPATDPLYAVAPAEVGRVVQMELGKLTVEEAQP